jgi:hypothetical protein
MFFDLGATTFVNSLAVAGQGWFYLSYRAAGLPFDRVFAWEAQPVSPAEVCLVLCLLSAKGGRGCGARGSVGFWGAGAALQGAVHFSA